MAKGRIPGPLGRDSLLGPIDDGTLTLNPSPIPGPVGFTFDPFVINDGIDFYTLVSSHMYEKNKPMNKCRPEIGEKSVDPIPTKTYERIENIGLEEAKIRIALIYLLKIVFIQELKGPWHKLIRFKYIEHHELWQDFKESQDWMWVCRDENANIIKIEFMESVLTGKTISSMIQGENYDIEKYLGGF